MSKQNTNCPFCGSSMLRLADDLLPGVAPSTIFTLGIATVSEHGNIIMDKEFIFPTHCRVCEKCGYVALFLAQGITEGAISEN